MKHSIFNWFCLAVIFWGTGGRPAQAENICFDFEDGTLQGWQVLDGKFGQLIGRRQFEFNHPKVPYTKDGTWYLTTLELPGGNSPSDRFTGIIESPVIRLSHPDITVKVGGGALKTVGFSVHDIAGRELARANGENCETMFKRTISLPAYVGKEVFFRIFDDHEGGWGHVTVDSVVCQGDILPDVSAKHFELRRKQIQNTLQMVFTEQSLEAAITGLGRHYPAEYPADDLLHELKSLDKDDAEAMSGFAKKALVGMNPVVNQAPIVFTTRKQYRSDHHNTATMFQFGEINQNSYDTNGQLKLLDVRSGKVDTLYHPGATGTVRDPEIDYDGKRIVFSMRHGRQDFYHIHVLDLDTGEVSQLTKVKGVSDIDPTWLPDGGILFTSTREPKYCMCNRHIMGNLFRMGRDGSNIHQIGKSTLHEGHPSLLPDGRVLYDRWEYVDRNFGNAQGLWVCNPDGTNHAIFWGNNTTSPGGVIDARPLAAPNRVIAVLGSCHDRPWGALGIIDRGMGIDGREPVLRTWPADYRKSIKTDGQSFDSTVSLKIKYEDPYPLDDEHFLCSRKVGRGELMGIYYLDLHGNEILVHSEEPGCYDPMPLRAHPRPPVLVNRRVFAAQKAPGLIYLQNVYAGTHMAGVAPGSVKALRIIESPEKRNWTARGWQGQGEQAPAMNWHNFENKRVLGTVPVEADGSAYFEVPGNTFVFFQALDADGMMIQSMRSGAYVQPGEVQGCVGCHESRTSAAEAPVRPQAMLRSPSRLNGWLGKPRLFSYQKEVQPVFDKNCLACHDYGKAVAKKLNLSGDKDLVFCTSYVDLWSQNMIKCVGGGPAEVQAAGSWGSRASQLVQVLKSGHHNVKLTPEEWERLTTWIDLNGPYYAYYESAHSGNPGGRAPLTDAEVKQIERLAGQPVHIAWWRRQRSQLNFDRPESSRILENCKAEARESVLAIIRQGAERLKQVPRADMDGFTPAANELRREEKYQQRLQVENTVYQAIREGWKVFDE